MHVNILYLTSFPPPPPPPKAYIEMEKYLKTEQAKKTRPRALRRSGSRRCNINSQKLLKFSRVLVGPKLQLINIHHSRLY